VQCAHTWVSLPELFVTGTTFSISEDRLFSVWLSVRHLVHNHTTATVCTQSHNSNCVYTITQQQLCVHNHTTATVSTLAHFCYNQHYRLLCSIIFYAAYRDKTAMSWTQFAYMAAMYAMPKSPGHSPWSRCCHPQPAVTVGSRHCGVSKRLLPAAPTMADSSVIVWKCK